MKGPFTRQMASMTKARRPFPLRKPLGRLGVAMPFFVALAFLPSLARADVVDKLIQILKTSDSYKVRMTAAISLGKKKDKRAVPALMFALRDAEYTVRALSAAALGQIGDKRAVSSLKSMLGRESNSFAKGQAKKALAKLSGGGGGGGGSIVGAKVYLRVGKIANNSPIGGKTISSALGAALLAQFGKVSKIVTRWPGGKPSAAELRKRGIKAFVLDGAIQKLTNKPSGGNVEISCFIRVSLATYPQNSMKAFYSGGASMSVSQRDFDRQKVTLYKELVVATAGGARQQFVTSFFSRMGIR